LSGLLLELLIACPLALLFAAGLAYWLAARALRPVEEIRLEAEAVSAQEPGRKLPVPEADDEIAHLSVTLNDMLGRLESSLVRERGFVSNASHELRTPLALVKTEVDLALSRPRSNSELEEALRSIAGEIDRLSQLVDDLLLLARMDEGRLPKRRTRLVGREMFETVRDRFARRAASAGRMIEVDVDPMVWFVGDRQLVLQVLSNLVENALRYGSGTIELTTREAGGNVELHVMDRGPGFPPGFLPTAFDRFSRVHPMKMTGGAGLGLAIVAAIAKAHGGHAGAVNRPEGGADVWVSLPYSLRMSRRTFNSGE
jgi:signal transduction histidine kinase